MTFDEELRAMFDRAEHGIEGRPLLWEETIMKARRSRQRHLTAAVAGTFLVLGGAVFALTSLVGGPEAGPPVAPASTPTPDQSPSPPPSSASDSSPTPAAPRCSAQRQGLTGELDPQPSLPQAVQATRDRIAELAAACDYEGLERYAGKENFTFSFGDGGSAAEYWRSVDRREEVTALMVKLLSVKPARDDSLGDKGPVFYLWPGVAGPSPTEEDWAELEKVYTDEEIARFRRDFEMMGSYFGYRVGIDEEGKWLFFVAGD